MRDSRVESAQGPGKDKLVGGPGRDKLNGGGGKDKEIQ
jgi:hypothetical protein